MVFECKIFCYQNLTTWHIDRHFLGSYEHSADVHFVKVPDLLPSLDRQSSSLNSDLLVLLDDTVYLSPYELGLYDFLIFF